jgi:hypothetical protein
MSHANPAPLAADEEMIAYRSLSTLAVLSFILGLLSILSFAPSRVFMFMFPPAALVTGLLAVRQITLAPEVWTGKRLAKLGIALALLSFTGSALVRYVQSKRIGQHGRIVADRFINKLKAGDTEGAFWLKFPRESRSVWLNKTADDVPGQILQQYGMFHTENTPMCKALMSGEATIEFEAIEHTTANQGGEYAVVLYNYRSATEDTHTHPHPHPHPHTHLMVLATSYAGTNPHERSWFVQEFKTDYEPHSYEDSKRTGHGHAH